MSVSSPALLSPVLGKELHLQNHPFDISAFNYVYTLELAEIHWSEITVCHIGCCSSDANVILCSARIIISFCATGMGSTATVVYKRDASMIAEKHDKPYSRTIHWIRCRLNSPREEEPACLRIIVAVFCVFSRVITPFTAKIPLATHIKNYHPHIKKARYEGGDDEADDEAGLCNKKTTESSSPP